MATTSDERFEVGRWQRSLLPGGLFIESDTRRSARDWLVDIVLFAFAIGIGVVVLAETWSKHSTATAIADIVFGTLACLSLWWRRRAPTAVGLFCTVLSAFFALPGGAGLVGIFNAAIRSSQRGLVAVVVCGVCGPAVYAALYAGDGGYSWSYLIIGALLTAVAVGWGLFVRSRRSLIISLRERADRLQAEQRLHAERARDAERSRIAREMHDVLAHRLSLLSVHAGALEYRPDAPPEIAEAAGVIRSTAHSALDELRAIIGIVRDAGDGEVPEAPQPTLAQLPTLVEESRAAGMRVSCQIDVHDGANLPDALGRTAYRIVQEGLTNARKHAPGAAVEVTVSQPAGAPLEVQILTRRPVGIEATASAVPGAGTGLIGLSERVALAGGELVHGPRPDGDYLLRATLPVSV